jgi:hypothetical protein
MEWSFYKTTPGFNKNWGYPLVGQRLAIYSQDALPFNSWGEDVTVGRERSCAWCVLQEGRGGRGEGVAEQGREDQKLYVYIVYTLVLIGSYDVCLRHLYNHIPFNMKYYYGR